MSSIDQSGLRPDDDTNNDDDDDDDDANIL